MRYIGNNAFYYCENLTKVTFKENSQLKNIGEWLFEGCANLVEIEIPSSVTTIGYGAFCGCAELEDLDIPSSVICVEPYAFSGCEKLMREDNGVFYVDKWVVWYDGTSGEVSLREDTVGISDDTFSYSGLTSIEIPSSVMYIGAGAFHCTGLRNIEIPSGILSISEGAFANCYSLESITFEENTLKSSSAQSSSPVGILKTREVILLTPTSLPPS